MVQNPYHRSEGVGSIGFGRNSTMTAIPSDPFLPADIPEQFNIAAYFVDAPAARHPKKTAIVGEPRAVTYAEVSELTNRVGNALLELGVSRGDRVLIVLPDSAEFIAAYFGANRGPERRTHAQQC